MDVGQHLLSLVLKLGGVPALIERRMPGLFLWLGMKNWRRIVRVHLFNLEGNWLGSRGLLERGLTSSLVNSGYTQVLNVIYQDMETRR